MKINNIQDDAKHISVNKNTDVVLEIFERDWGNTGASLA